MEVFRCSGLLDVTFVEMMPRIRELSVRYLSKDEVERVSVGLRSLEDLTMRVPHQDSFPYDKVLRDEFVFDLVSSYSSGVHCFHFQKNDLLYVCVYIPGSQVLTHRSHICGELESALRSGFHAQN